MKKQVLTINECYSDNLGDQAIAKSLSDLLLKQGYVAIQADYTGNILNRNTQSAIEESKVSFKIKVINLVKKIEILRSLGWGLKSYKRVHDFVDNEFDFAVIGGGQLLLNNAHFPLALFLWTHLLKRKKKDIYLFAVGCGDSFSQLNKYLISRSLKYVKGIYVRDESSRLKLKVDFGFDSEVIPDVAYAYPKSSQDITEKKTNTIIVGIVDYRVFKRYAGEVGAIVISEEEYMQLWLDKILEHEFDSILF